MYNCSFHATSQYVLSHSMLIKQPCTVHYQYSQAWHVVAASAIQLAVFFSGHQQKCVTAAKNTVYTIDRQVAPQRSAQKASGKSHGDAGDSFIIATSKSTSVSRPSYDIADKFNWSIIEVVEESS